ncbi:MAG: Molybdopterin molybdenumtransferase [Promethearchaeota archaeon]|nr:MAG: Molybdopterin molybdenumtransferase [Candidatus Lokiarchaeota archaeon]
MERLRKIGFSKLSSLEETVNKLFERIKVLPDEEIETKFALNRILAEDIVSKINVPHFDRSAMDGYAIIAEDSFGASQKSPKVVKKIGTIEIGEAKDIKIKQGEAVRISTGAAIPEGANSVVKIEDTEIENEEVTLYTSVAPGKNVSKQGEDIKEGETILERGLQLGPEHISLITSQGINKIAVKLQPNMSVFSTGDELVELGQELGKNQIYNSNTPMISNLVKAYGGLVVREDTLKDNKQLIKTELFEALEISDIIVFTGGTSVGTKDLLPEIMNEEAEVFVHGIATRPGAPLLISFLQEKVIFCLPGTPVAAYVNFLRIVGPTIRKMMDSKKVDPRVEVSATLTRDVPVSYLGYVHYLRVKLEKEENQFYASPVRLKGSGVISSLTRADGIVEISPSEEGLFKGDKVLVKLFPK